MTISFIFIFIIKYFIFITSMWKFLIRNKVIMTSNFSARNLFMESFVGKTKIKSNQNIDNK